MGWEYFSDEEKELEKELSKISSYPQMDNINFSTKEIFKMPGAVQYLGVLKNILFFNWLALAQT